MLKGVKPRIIPRKEHRISRKKVSPNALRTLYRLHTRGFIAYLVGGCVRDLLLERTPKDFDIGTNATPTQIKRLFHNCRLIGRRFRLAHLHFPNEIVEVSTFRGAAGPSDNENGEEEGRTARFHRHIKDVDGMILADNVFGTPEEDALRRDFTINALAYNIADFSVIDYSTGLDDLHRGLIRPIGDPRVRFTEDPVRMLRAVRFAASHSFVIEPTAWDILRELSSTISRASPARLYEEVQKIFLLGSAQPAFSILEKSGLLLALFPALGRWLYENSSHPALVDANLKRLDQLHMNGASPSPALFLASVFGPDLEKAALMRHREGIPRQRALNETCNGFIEDISKTVSIPGKVGTRLCALLALQSSLRKIPPRRPASLAGRPEFKEAAAYLYLTSETMKEHAASLDWWDTYLLKNPPITPEEQPVDKAPPPNRKRKRRRRSRHTPKTSI